MSGIMPGICTTAPGGPEHPDQEGPCPVGETQLKLRRIQHKALYKETFLQDYLNEA